jgi:alpha-1,3-rhamnosyl/mannosyltransferase
VSNADLPGIYSNAVALIFTSTYEGFGFPPLEAMASGTPALVAKTPIAQEIYGDSVSYFQSGSVSELRELIRKRFSHPTFFDAKVNEGLSVSAKFTWKACAQATAQSYFDFFRNRS